MGFKQTLILGGAVLLLAACDRATAPVLNVQEGGAAAYAKEKTTSTDTSTSSTNTLQTTTTSLTDLCGISLSSGNTQDSLCIQQEW